MEPLLLHMFSKLRERGSRDHGHASSTCGAQEQGIRQSFATLESKIVHHMAFMIKPVAISSVSECSVPHCSTPVVSQSAVCCTVAPQ